MRKTFNVRPVSGGMATDNPALYTAATLSPEILNCRFDQNSLKKRWGYALDRSPLSKVYDISLFPLVNGTRYTLYLTATDLVSRESAGTFSYKTETYTTGTITDVTGAAVTGNSTAWNTSGAAAGDKFILDADHTATSEIDSNWATIQSVDSATGITLTGNYTGTTGAMSGTYKIRKVYSVPSNERYFTAIVNDKFCFGNGNMPVQYWAGTGYAADLNATLALNARYGIEYANRLFLADVDASGVRSAITLRWSKEGDPTNWTDSTAGELDLMDTESVIMGLGKTGGNLIIFKPDSFYIYGRTGEATDPISLSAYRPGIGCVAPYSPVNFMGTTAWLGRDDFYVMNGDTAESIGEKIRTKFFESVGDTEIKKVFGAVNHLSNEVMWFANTDEGQRAFVYNYKWQKWMINTYPTEVSAFGKGAV